MEKYLYAGARIRTLENSVIGQERLERLRVTVSMPVLRSWRNGACRPSGMPEPVRSTVRQR